MLPQEFGILLLSDVVQVGFESLDVCLWNFVFRARLGAKVLEFLQLAGPGKQVDGNRAHSMPLTWISNRV